MNTATWIAVTLLAPFWWGTYLLSLALLGDMSPRWRLQVSRLFDRLESLDEPTEAAVPWTRR